MYTSTILSLTAALLSSTASAIWEPNELTRISLNKCTQCTGLSQDQIDPRSPPADCTSSITYDTNLSQLEDRCQYYRQPINDPSIVNGVIPNEQSIYFRVNAYDCYYWQSETYENAQVSVTDHIGWVYCKNSNDESDVFSEWCFKSDWLPGMSDGQKAIQCLPGNVNCREYAYCGGSF